MFGIEDAISVGLIICYMVMFALGFIAGQQR